MEQLDNHCRQRREFAFKSGTVSNVHQTWDDENVS